MKFLDKIHFEKKVLDSKEKLKNMSPKAIFYDMCHFFAKQQIKNGERAATVLLRQIEANQYLSLSALARYKEEKPEVQILLHFQMYTTLIQAYKLYIKSQTYAFALASLTDEEYKNLPKQYRGLFYKRASNKYALNEPQTEMVIAYNKKNANKLIDLLIHANELLSLVRGAPDSEQHKRQFIGGVAAIEKLHNVFVEIAKISVPVKVKKSNKPYSAKSLYYTYCCENDFCKNKFLRAQNELKSIKAEKIQKIHAQKERYDNALKNIECWYRDVHSYKLRNLGIKTKQEKCR